MRMKLYEVEIVLAEGTARSHVVAPSKERAVELVREHYDENGGDWTSVSVDRIDEDLAGETRLGLDGALETAPVGFASFHSSLGWLVHAAALHRLRLFKIEEISGEQAFVIAPDADIAAAVFAASHHRGDGGERLYHITDARRDLTDERRAGSTTCSSSVPSALLNGTKVAGTSAEWQRRRRHRVPGQRLDDSRARDRADCSETDALRSGARADNANIAQKLILPLQTSVIRPIVHIRAYMHGEG